MGVYRFSLLHLQHGEEYFEDYSVQCFPPDLTESEALQRAIRGRLKLCSQSVLFEPQDSRYPLIKVPGFWLLVLCCVVLCCVRDFFS
jgi:factor associated with neutral sphingomyelinase activation